MDGESGRSLRSVFILSSHTQPVWGPCGLPETQFLSVAARGRAPWKPDWGLLTSAPAPALSPLLLEGTGVGAASTRGIQAPRDRRQSEAKRRHADTEAFGLSLRTGCRPRS